IAESGASHAVDAVIAPLRDIFAAIFFISVGTLLDPTEVLDHWPLVLVLTALVLVGKTFGVTIGAFLAGNGLKRSLRAGMSLAQIGEFAFIIAGLGASTGASRGFLLPVVVAVSCLTALTTPAMIRVSERVAADIDHRLPRPLQTATSFYEAWIETLSARKVAPSQQRRLRGRLRLLAVDVALLVAVVVGHGLFGAELARALSPGVGAAETARWGVFAVVALLALFLVVAILRQAHHIGEDLAARVVPKRTGDGADLSRAPRRALLRLLEVAIGLGLGLPLVAVLSPFLPFSSAAIALALVVAALCVAAWRTLGNFQGHVRAGTELVVELLARQGEAGVSADAADPGASALRPLEQVRELLPGFPDMEAVELHAGDPAIGESLASLNLRALTGATVMAIAREGAG
ncbi:MAG: cation:proton antiporter, partial [Myxococcales bacterium]|nr:cation:proton antiporter [Myxococcales bacterium]